MIIFEAIYWAVIKAYGAVLFIASFFNSKAKLFITGRAGLIKKIEQQLSSEHRPRIWMHCASLGEFEQGRPVLEKLQKKYSRYAIVLTFFSPSGYEVRKNYSGADYVFYLPLDSPGNAIQFLTIVHPELCIFIKYEFWYFYLSAIKRKGLHAILISGIFRKDQPFFTWYGMLHRQMLRTFTHLFVQNDTSARLLTTIGINEISVSGDTRFDRVVIAASHKDKLFIAETFTENYQVIVAGSTWKEDEVFLRDVLELLPQQWKLILVPHEVNEHHTIAIETLFAGNTVRWTRWNDVNEKRVLIVDQVGFLMQLYSLANVAWIGGGFGREGVHNVLEAAVYGIPCVYGPIYHQFVEAAELIKQGGAFSTAQPAVFAEMIKKWEDNDHSYRQAGSNARGYVYANKGATEAIIDYVAEKNLLII